MYLTGKYKTGTFSIAEHCNLHPRTIKKNTIPTDDIDVHTQNIMPFQCLTSIIQLLLQASHKKNGSGT